MQSSSTKKQFLRPSPKNSSMITNLAINLTASTNLELMLLRKKLPTILIETTKSRNILKCNLRKNATQRILREAEKSSNRSLEVNRSQQKMTISMIPAPSTKSNPFDTRKKKNLNEKTREY
jgi:hypothetical protein